MYLYVRPDFFLSLLRGRSIQKDQKVAFNSQIYSS